MRVVTLNCWKNEGDLQARLLAIAEGIAALSPDIVFLQEVYADDSLDVARLLARKLSVNCVAHSARAKRRGGIYSTSGMAILSRWEFVGGEALELPSASADGQRIAQRAALRTPLGVVRALNLHLTHLRGSEAHSLRALQLATALDWGLSEDRGALIFAGDFNAKISNAPLATLLSSRGADFGADDWSAFASTRTAGDGPAIDHVGLIDSTDRLRIGCRDNVLDQVCQRSGVFASDHVGVMVEIAVNDAQAAE